MVESRADGDAPPASVIVVARGDRGTAPGHVERAHALRVGLAVEQSDAVPVAGDERDCEQRGEHDGAELARAVSRVCFSWIAVAGSRSHTPNHTNAIGRPGGASHVPAAGAVVSVKPSERSDPNDLARPVGRERTSALGRMHPSGTGVAEPYSGDCYVAMASREARAGGWEQSDHPERRAFPAERDAPGPGEKVVGRGRQVR